MSELGTKTGSKSKWIGRRVQIKCPGIFCSPPALSAKSTKNCICLTSRITRATDAIADEQAYFDAVHEALLHSLQLSQQGQQLTLRLPAS